MESPLDRLKRLVLSWDFWELDAEIAQKGNGLYDELQPLPNSFKDVQVHVAQPVLVATPHEHVKLLQKHIVRMMCCIRFLAQISASCGGHSHDSQRTFPASMMHSFLWLLSSCENPWQTPISSWHLCSIGVHLNVLYFPHWLLQTCHSAWSSSTVAFLASLRVSPSLSSPACITFWLLFPS